MIVVALVRSSHNGPCYGRWANLPQIGICNQLLCVDGFREANVFTVKVPVPVKLTDSKTIQRYGAGRHIVLLKDPTRFLRVRLVQVEHHVKKTSSNLIIIWLRLRLEWKYFTHLPLDLSKSAPYCSIAAYSPAVHFGLRSSLSASSWQLVPEFRSLQPYSNADLSKPLGRQYRPPPLTFAHSL